MSTGRNLIQQSTHLSLIDGLFQKGNLRLGEDLHFTAEIFHPRQHHTGVVQDGLQRFNDLWPILKANRNLSESPSAVKTQQIGSDLGFIESFERLFAQILQLLQFVFELLKQFEMNSIFTAAETLSTFH